MSMLAEQKTANNNQFSQLTQQVSQSSIALTGVHRARLQNSLVSTVAAVSPQVVSVPHAADADAMSI